MLGERHSRCLIDGNLGASTPIGTFEREIHAAAWMNDTVLIATKEYANQQSREGRLLFTKAYAH